MNKTILSVVLMAFLCVGAFSHAAGKLSPRQKEERVNTLLFEISDLKDDLKRKQNERSGIEKELSAAKRVYNEAEKARAVVVKEIGYAKARKPETMSAEEKKKLEDAEKAALDAKENRDSLYKDLADIRKELTKIQVALDKKEVALDKLESTATDNGKDEVNDKSDAFKSSEAAY